MSVEPNKIYKYQAGGSLRSNSSTYVTRQADTELLEALLAGDYCYVLNSRQMGKSSLRIHTMAKLREQGIACAEIELSGIGSQQITPAQWYGGIIQELISGFKLKVKRQVWLQEREDLSPVQRLKEFIEQVLLAQISQKLVVFIDEIDSVLGLSFLTDDFFALIRNCYEKRAYSFEYQRLTFVLLGVATPSDLIQDEHATPFNIGRAIELRGFQLHECDVLGQGLAAKSCNPKTVLQQVLHWTGGQPFLTQKLCWIIATTDNVIPTGEEAKQVERLVRSRLIDHWELHDEPEHLKTIRDRILRNSRRQVQLLKLYRRILQTGKIAANNSPEHLELRLSGLVAKRGKDFSVYNPIYASVFNRDWVARQLKAARAIPPIPAWIALLTSIGAAALVVGVRSIGILQPFELQTLDQLMRLRPAEAADKRILIITISEADIQYQDRMKMERRGSVSDQALAQLLQKLDPHRPAVIGLDIYHDFEFESGLAANVSRNPRFIATCELAQTVEQPTSISAPPGIPAKRLGFTDFPIDPQYIIRRQLLAAPSVPECSTPQSFSLGIALNYLTQQEISSVHHSPVWQKLSNGAMQISGVVVPKLTTHAGGYALPPEELGGYQTLVNYRSADPQQISLTAVLNGSLDAQLANLVRDRIILIGVSDTKDAHLTPYSHGAIPNKMLGVVLHAHMTSQVISTVLDRRPLIWWLSEWGEAIWISGWSLIGGLLTWQLVQRSPLMWGLISCISLISLWGSCYVILLSGGWMPLIPGILVFIAASGCVTAVIFLHIRNTQSAA